MEDDGLHDDDDVSLITMSSHSLSLCAAGALPAVHQASVQPAGGRQADRAGQPEGLGQEEEKILRCSPSKEIVENISKTELIGKGWMPTKGNVLSLYFWSYSALTNKNKLVTYTPLPAGHKRKH